MAATTAVPNKSPNKSQWVCVGGTWDADGGRPSKLFDQFCGGIVASGVSSIEVLNGGLLGALVGRARTITMTAGNVGDIVVWMPDVPNDAAAPKIVEGLKEAVPFTLVISKRVDNRSIDLADVIARGLKVHANLIVVVDKPGYPVFRDRALFEGTVIDPLGNSFTAQTENFHELGYAVGKRASEISGYRRIRSYPHSTDAVLAPDDPAFYALVRALGERFTELVPSPAHPERFLGNAAFRCTRGFPAMRVAAGDVFVSRRNVDKATIGPEDFVRAALFTLRSAEGNALLSSVGFDGKAKPSVDAPIVLRLFERYPNVRYMVHGHVYVAEGPTTRRALPCGAVEEADEVAACFPDKEVSDVALNLRGHGCLMMLSKPELPAGWTFFSRPLPEPQDVGV